MCIRDRQKAACLHGVDIAAGGVLLGQDLGCGAVGFQIVPEPVSYTHLDVYKRQGVDISHIRIVEGRSAPTAFICVSARGENNIVVNPATVSYTHLDVYKRQV